MGRKSRSKSSRAADRQPPAAKPLGQGTRHLILAVLAVAVLAALVARANRRADTRYAGDPVSADAEPIPPTYAASVPGLPRLAAVGAGECIPCKAMAPIRAELRREYDGVLVVDFYDVWKDPDAGLYFGIRAIPTLIYYDATGRELGRQEGFVPKATILATLQRFGISLTDGTTGPG